MCLIKEIEIWKSLDFLGYPNYEISTFGRVRSLNRITTDKNGKEYFRKGRILKGQKHFNRYIHITIKKKQFLLHRLVALAFIPNPENLPIVNHKDQNPSNNHVDNLEFCTQQYNTVYNNAHIKRGEKLKGYHHTEETKQKISKILKGKPKLKLRGKSKSIEHKKKLSEAHKGKPNYHKRVPIIQLDLQNNFICEWDSATQASTELKMNNRNISACCRGNRNQCGGFKWVYKSDYKPLIPNLN